MLALNSMITRDQINLKQLKSNKLAVCIRFSLSKNKFRRSSGLTIKITIINKRKKMKKTQTAEQRCSMICVSVCSCHFTYMFQSESTLYSCLNVKELLAEV